MNNLYELVWKVPVSLSVELYLAIFAKALWLRRKNDRWKKMRRLRTSDERALAWFYRKSELSGLRTKWTNLWLRGFQRQSSITSSREIAESNQPSRWLGRILDHSITLLQLGQTATEICVSKTNSKLHSRHIQTVTAIASQLCET